MVLLPFSVVNEQLNLRTSLFSYLLEEHILCVFIYIYKQINCVYISRDIHHIVDTRVLKDTSI